MSSYYTRWCAIHGEWDDDVDCPSECPECLEAGTAPSQLETKEKATLRVELAEKDARIERLTKEKQDEFEIASGYHKKWQASEERIERLTAALASLDLGSVPESEVPAAVALRLTLMIQKAQAALSGTTTTHRLVSVERLREIEDFYVTIGEGVPDWLEEVLREEKT